MVVKMDDKEDLDAVAAARLLNRRAVVTTTDGATEDVQWQIRTSTLIEMEESWFSQVMNAPSMLHETGEPGETYQWLFRDVLANRDIWLEEAGKKGRRGKSIALWISTVFQVRKEENNREWGHDQLEIEIQKAMDSILDQQRGDQGLRNFITALVEHRDGRSRKPFALQLLIRRIIQRVHSNSTSRRCSILWWRTLIEVLQLAEIESVPSSHPLQPVFSRSLLSGILTAAQLSTMQLFCPSHLSVLLRSHPNLAFRKTILLVNLALGLISLDQLLTLNITSWMTQRWCKELHSSLQSLPTKDIFSLSYPALSSNWQLKLDELSDQWGIRLPGWKYYSTRWFHAEQGPGSPPSATATSNDLHRGGSEHPPAYETATGIVCLPPAYGTRFPEPNKLLVKEFQAIVGAIVVLESPMSVISLSKLLGLTEGEISLRLSPLQSVVSVPSDPTQPVQLYCPSFREYLLAPRMLNETPFCIDKKEIHQTLATRCLHICNGLQRNMCGITPGTGRAQIDRRVIDATFHPEMQYACRYWAYHLIQSKDPTAEMANAHSFLLTHVLHWIEAMGILGLSSEVLGIINQLQLALQTNVNLELSKFLHDVKRFVLRYRQLVEDFPLQVYYSCLVFAPKMSIIRKLFEAELPHLISVSAGNEENWSAELQTLECNADRAYSVAFLPDGHSLAAACSKDHVSTGNSPLMTHSHSIHLWDVDTGALQRTFTGCSGNMRSAFSPDGRVMVSASQDMTVQLWDTTNGTLRRTLPGHSERVVSVAFSSDGQFVASGSADKTVRLWNAARGTMIHIFEGHSRQVNSVVFSPNGRLLASSCYETLCVWDTATCTLLHILGGQSGTVSSAVFSPDGQLLAAASYSTIRLWDTATGVIKQSLKGHLGTVKSLAFSPSSRLLASGSNSLQMEVVSISLPRTHSDQTAQLWNTMTGVPKTLEEPSRSVTSVAFSPDGRRLATASFDMTVMLWDTGTGSLQQTLTGHSREVTSVEFSPDSQLLASTSCDSTVRLWDVTISAVSHSPVGHKYSVHSVVFSPDGRILASISTDAILLWDVVTGTLQLNYPEKVGRSLNFSPDGSLFVFVSRNAIQLWDAASCGPRRIIKGSLGNVDTVNFSPNSRLLASTSCEARTLAGIIQLWDVATGTVKHTLKGHECLVSSMKFSPDSHFLASGSGEVIHLWDTATGVLQQTLMQQNLTDSRQVVGSVAFSPDGVLLASGSFNTIRVWDAASGALQQTFTNHWDSEMSIAFSLDNQLLASGSHRGAVRVWDVNTGTLRHTLNMKGMITDLEFSVDASYLITNLGYLHLHHPWSRGANLFTVDGQWVTHRGEKALWLPHEYRPECSAIKNNNLALGHGSGRVSIFNFSPSSAHREPMR